MNKSVKVIALCGVIGLTAVSCQKENLVENPGVVAQNDTVRTVLYNIDGVEHRISLVGEDAWNDFLQHMFALAEEGHKVSFRNEDKTASIVPTKETVTFSTKKKSEAYAWCAEMAEAGYDVLLEYDATTGMYNCTATRP